MNVKKGDNVIVIAGKDRGKKGVVEKVFPKTNHVLIDGINLKKRRSRARAQGEKGATVEVPRPLHASNVQIFDGGAKKGVRTGMKIEGDKKTRVSKATGKAI